jgi:DNA-binding GntR family transcriptional regulator
MQAVMVARRGNRGERQERRGQNPLISVITIYTVYSMQKEIEPIAQGNVSHSVEAEIRRLIIEGVLAEGERLNEVHLSAQLRVSRTPVREALNRLVAEGSLESRPRIGFSVRPLTEDEFTQLYDIRPILDPAALRMAGLPTKSQLTRLEALNRSLARARSAEEMITQDDAWHLELLAHCPNRMLVDLIRDMMRRTRRYELALMREAAGRTTAIQTHDEILAALAGQDLDAACRALEDNMRSGREPVIRWLRSRKSR